MELFIEDVEHDYECLLKRNKKIRRSEAKRLLPDYIQMVQATTGTSHLCFAALIEFFYQECALFYCHASRSTLAQ